MLEYAISSLPIVQIDMHHSPRIIDNNSVGMSIINNIAVCSDKKTILVINANLAVFLPSVWFDGMVLGVTP
jgi:hypothetical protein